MSLISAEFVLRKQSVS